MSRVQKNNWCPSASVKNLRLRAEILKKIRDFFSARSILEVETPLLCHTSVTDPYIESIPAYYQSSRKEERYYLQTSPEYAMKRLLAANSGSIYQICKAFRQDEIGRFHNPEFTLLEWYHIGFDHHQLMQEMDELLQQLLGTNAAVKKSYQEIFQDFLKINPHTINESDLKKCLKQNHLSLATQINDIDTLLQLLFTHCIEPHLGKNAPCFIYDFPASQAALSRIQPSDPPLAARFEVYFQGIELANGFHELCDASEQRKRFQKNLLLREKEGLHLLPIDELFLSALDQGLPDCAGVALGLDRLIMLAAKVSHIQEVLSFDFSKA